MGAREDMPIPSWLSRRRYGVPVAVMTDVCVIVEGCYPHVSGGVSSWIDWLLRSQAETSFSVVAVVAGNEARQQKYQFPDNLHHIRWLILQGSPQSRILARRNCAGVGEELGEALTDLIRGGGLQAFRRLIGLVNDHQGGLTLHDLMETPLSLQIIRSMYDALMPHASFLQFYWAWRALFGGLFAVLKAELPPAGCYHAISTGYAGLLAARAAVETGRPALITEHGIYTNERRIEILMADWISDTVEKGLAIDDPRMDLRDLWISTFEAYARIAYEACSVITTLYRDNQELQLAAGAEVSRLKVIANGIDVGAFAALGRPSPADQPTMALIGRVVPIKDIKSFIAAAAAVRVRVPDVRALVIGPTDEDPGYFRECRQLVEELGVGDCVTFTGNRRIVDVLSSIHVVVLTSLSEAQPLVLLEAGAAGIPCVATNVGACREIIEGTSDETAPQIGGFITDLVAPDQVADRVVRLLESDSLRVKLGESLRRRVQQRYASKGAQQHYAALYADVLAMGRKLPLQEAS